MTKNADRKDRGSGIKTMTSLIAWSKNDVADQWASMNRNPIISHDTNSYCKLNGFIFEEKQTC